MRKKWEGKPYTTCQRSGFLVPHDETVVEWTGLRVWQKFADPRHPQDFVRVSKRPQALEGQNYDDNYTEDNNFNEFLELENSSDDYRIFLEFENINQFMELE